MEYPGGISALFGKARHLVQRRFLPRRNDCARVRHRIGGQTTNPGTARPDARTRAQGNGSRRAWHWHVAHLPTGILSKTEELIELCKVAAKYQGKYISHMRS